MAALLLAGASLSGKIGDPGAAQDIDLAAQRLRLVRALGAAGWELRASGTIAAAHGAPVLRFAHSACPQPLDVVELPPSGDADALLGQTLGPGERLFFLHRGRISDRPPRLAYLDAKLGAVTERLGVWTWWPAPVLAVVEPATCPASRAIAWPDL